MMMLGCVCVYELLSVNVGVQNIAPVTPRVLKIIVHKSVKSNYHAATCIRIQIFQQNRHIENTQY